MKRFVILAIVLLPFPALADDATYCAKLADLAPMNVSGDVPAQILFSVREEMALTLEDLVMRRTSIGQFGKPAPELLAQLAAMMGTELGWSPARHQSEIDGVNRLYVIAP